MCVACVPHFLTAAMQTQQSQVAQDASSGSTSSPENDQFAMPPYLIWRPMTETSQAGAFQRYDASRFEANYIVHVQDDVVVAPTASGDCGGEVVSDKLGLNLLTRLNQSGLRWAQVAEPFIHQGVGPEFPMAVALDSQTGSEIVDVVTTDGAMLLADGDRSSCSSFPDVCDTCPSGACDASGVCCEIACTVDATCPTDYCDPMMGVCRFSPRADRRMQ